MIIGAAGKLNEDLDARISELTLLRLLKDGKDVASETMVVAENSSGGCVFAEATSAAGIVAAPGPLPTAGTIPICFEAESSES